MFEMCPFFQLFGFTIPAYGFMIASGIIAANIIAMAVLVKMKQDFNDFAILESYCILGGFAGAKLLYLLVSIKDIDWSQIVDIHYFNRLMSSGFVFYGGLIGGLIFVYLGGRIHGIKPKEYIQNFIFLVPMIHGFGRMGCFFAGCCYGIPYTGFGAVIFPKNAFGLSGVSLFPVQLAEAIGLFIIAVFILFIQIKYTSKYTAVSYFTLYSILRFGLEKLRYDDARGIYFGFSTSQWISIGLFMAAVILFVRQNKGGKRARNADQRAKRADTVKRQS